MIVRKRNKAGGVFYFNTATKKFASKSAYEANVKKSVGGAAKKIAKAASKSVCSTYGKALKNSRSSAAGKGLRCRCSPLARCGK